MLKWKLIGHNRGYECKVSDFLRLTIINPYKYLGEKVYPLECYINQHKIKLRNGPYFMENNLYIEFLKKGLESKAFRILTENLELLKDKPCKD